MALFRVESATIIFFIICHLWISSGAYDCSTVIHKDREGQWDYLGNVTFTVPFAVTDGWTMTITFDQEYFGLGGTKIYTVAHGPLKYGIMTNREDNGALTAGQRFSFRFNVNWVNKTQPIPAPISLKFFEIELCR